MADRLDDLHDAFQTLAADVPSELPIDFDLEETLMSQSQIRKQGMPKTVLIVAVAGLLLAIGGATVTAAGGVEEVREWFFSAIIVHEDLSETEVNLIPLGNDLTLDEGAVFLLDNRTSVSTDGDDLILSADTEDGSFSAPIEGLYLNVETGDGTIWTDGDEDPTVFQEGFGSHGIILFAPAEDKLPASE